MIRARLTAFTVALVVLVAAAAGCGSGDGAAPEPEGPPTGIDPSFGQDGAAVVSLGSGYAEATDVVVDAQGRPIVAGIAPAGTGVLLRLRTDGTPDAEFGDAGRVRTPFDGGARAVALAADGGIIVAGEGGGGFAVARYTQDGSIDPGFGTDGVSVATFEAARATANAVAVDTAGRITAGGTVFDPSDLTTQRLALVRYGPGGALDPDFGQAGRVDATTMPPVVTANSMVVDERGDIVVGGTLERSAPGQPANADGVLSRYSAGGVPEPGYGDGGSVFVDLGSPFDAINGVVLAGPTRIVGVGSTNPEGRGAQAALVAAAGIVADALPPLSEAFAALARPDGRLLVVARVAENGVSGDPNWEWALAAYAADLTPEAGFGRDGVIRSAVGKKANAIASAPDGRAVVVGCTCPEPPAGRGGFESNSSIVVARYLIGE